MQLLNTISVALLALFAIPLVIALCIKSPQWIALPMMAVLVLFSSSTWGQLEVENTIYSRGVGELNFSLLNVLLFATGFALSLRKLTNRHMPALAPPIAPYFVGFALLLLAHVLVGLVAGIDFFRIVGYAGILNILNMLLFMYFLIEAFKQEHDQERLLSAILVLAGVRAIFGLVRYIWFEGDSANPYRNLEGLDMKLIFFDISDNFIASLGAFLAAWRLSMPGIKLSLVKRVGIVLFLLLEIVTVALSFRRSSLIGMALMFVFLLYRLPGRQRSQFLFFSVSILLVTALVFFQQRLQYASKGEGNFISAMIYDISPQKDLETENRFYELLAAARSLGPNWLTGLGSWGTFTGDQEILSYHFGKFDFVHSGFGHIILKTGLIGLFLFCGMLVKFVAYYFRHARHVTGSARLLSDAGVAGLLFWIPTLMIGTPIVEFRTMLLIGLSLALPFIAVGMPQRQAAQPLSIYSPR